MKHLARISSIVLIITLLASCSGVEKVIKSNDFDGKYDIAMKYYNENSYSKAIQIFENLILYYRGREHAEDIAWYYAQALLHEEDYYTAAYQFNNFARKYPYSKRCEDARFMAAFSKYRSSPNHSLDQTLTKEAIKEFEAFAELYPQSTHIPEINQYLDELREKLMLKDYDIAYNYYHIEAYHAAYLSLQHFLSYYPESPKREDAMFYLLRSGYEYAINSREDKMRERLQQVINDFDRFATSFKDSKYIAQAQHIYTRTRAKLIEIEATMEQTSTTNENNSQK